MKREGAGGRALVSKLQATPNIIYLMAQLPGKGNNTQADASGISVNGKGTGSNVRINTALTDGGVDATGNTKRPGYVGLAHELGHARAMDQGVQTYEASDAKKTPGTTPQSEIHALANENMVRQEHNLPIRPSYYDPIPPPPTKKSEPTNP